MKTPETKLPPLVPKDLLRPPGWNPEAWEELVGSVAYHDMWLRVQRRLVPMQILLERAILITRPGMPFDVVSFLEQWEEVVVEYRKLCPLSKKK